MDRFNWNVVVLAAWNPAILTPAGIQKRLFGGDKSTFEVQFSVDGSAPPRVVIEQLVFVVTADSLAIQPVVPDTAGLRRAGQLAEKAAKVLPETPFSAAGLNFRFRFGQLPEGVLRGLTCPLDSALSSSDFVPVVSGLRRSYPHGDGRLNVSLDRNGDGGGTLVLNFHTEVRTRDDVSKWLVESFDQFVARKDAFLRSIGLDESPEEEAD